MTADGQYRRSDAGGPRLSSQWLQCGGAFDLACAWGARRVDVDGAPPLELTPLTVARFGTESWSEEQLRQQAAWQYRHFYGAV
jgi:hypothetical protein